MYLENINRDIYDVPSYGLTHSHDGMDRVQLAIKRCADVIFSLAGMILLSPLFVFIMIALKLNGHGSVIFSQERIGYRGRPFTIYKFRTMNKANCEDEPQLMSESDTNDMTTVQKFIRAHHLDELPQLWNVFKGDMSMVGPRPERKYFIDKIMEQDPDYVFIYEMRPGLTSEATIYNGYTTTMEKMLRRLHMDIHYLENRSLMLDVRIIFDTIVSIVSGKKF
jgi:lipopolysaccharide/colanic/teichoic acid biosynthesis glycosyltransferase